MRSKHKHCLSLGPRWTWIAAQLMRSRVWSGSWRLPLPLASSAWTRHIPDALLQQHCLGLASLAGAAGQTPPLFLSQARKRVGLAGLTFSFCLPHFCARLHRLQMWRAAASEKSWTVSSAPFNSQHLLRLPDGSGMETILGRALKFTPTDDYFILIVSR